MSQVSAIISTERSNPWFGFFRYADDLAPRRAPKPLRHIFSLMRNAECQLLVEEVVDLSAEWQQERAKLSVIENRTLRTKQIRISFFKLTSTKPDVDVAKTFSPVPEDARKNVVNDVEKFRALCSQEDVHCLGYLYLCTDFQVAVLSTGYEQEFPLYAFVREAVVTKEMAPFEKNECYFIHSNAEFKIEVCGHQFPPITGSYFAQQDKKTYCCAHAASMACLQNLYTSCQRDCPYTYESLNRQLGVNHLSRLGSDGLTIEEVQQVFLRAGFRCNTFDSKKGFSPEYVMYAAYSHIECGLPAVIGFGRGSRSGHAMAIVGHTFEESLWEGAARQAFKETAPYPFFSSMAWVNGLIIQDDNFGPYCILPLKELYASEPAVVAPFFPWSAGLSPMDIQFCACLLLYQPVLASDTERLALIDDICLALDARGINVHSDESMYWFRVLLHHMQRHELVLRTVPMTRKEYLGRLNSCLEEVGESIPGELEDKITDFLPDTPFWLVEISIPEIYRRNNRLLGEVLIECRSGKGGTSASKSAQPLLARLPGVVSLFSVQVHNGLRAVCADHYSLAMAYHYPICARIPLSKLQFLS
ncbi:MAG: hypothetical protein ACLFTT_10555 [Candidatus Hydrogenedentota bacterium]